MTPYMRNYHELTSSQRGASVASWVIVLLREGIVKSTSVNPLRDWGRRERERERGKGRRGKGWGKGEGEG